MPTWKVSARRRLPLRSRSLQPYLLGVFVLLIASHLCWRTGGAFELLAWLFMVVVWGNALMVIAILGARRHEEGKVHRVPRL